jgi:aspartate 1-decarboxylase
MLRRFLKAKIRDIRVTGTFLNYEGSIQLDENYMRKADILPFEEVQVLNMENGARFTTYAIKGKRGSGKAQLNGAAARQAVTGDRIMVLTYEYLSKDELRAHRPQIVRGGKRGKSNSQMLAEKGQDT